MRSSGVERSPRDGGPAIKSCDSCGEIIERHVYPDGEVELLNEATIAVTGGYGSFVDPLLAGPYRYTLCETCAMRLCREFGFDAAIAEHHTSTVCACPDRPPRDERNFPLPCECAPCTREMERRLAEHRARSASGS